MSQSSNGSSHRAAYNVLADQLAADGIDVEAVKSALKRQHIETPSWGYANSGTRFKAFAWPGAATTTQQKLDDAAMVQKMTGVAPSVAIHIPWDKPADDDYAGDGPVRHRPRRTHRRRQPQRLPGRRVQARLVWQPRSRDPGAAPSTMCSSASRS